ncbi:hypothetical protein GCM10023080_037530 [Streptomyces pseudoechinosporeus]
MAVMFAGLTVANVLGVPFGALVGERWGWRAAFWAITGIGLLALAGVAAFVPARVGETRTPTAVGHADPMPSEPSDGLRAQVRAFRSWQVWLTLAATALSYGGMFGAFSYIAYTFTEVGGFRSSDVAWLLMVYGVGLVVGNVIGGRAADRDRDRALVLALLGLTITLAMFGLLAGSATASVILVFLMGVFGFASVPGMITRVTDFAHGAALAASANVSASNIGNALGAWLGGLAISAGLGYTAPLYVGAGIALTSVIVMAVAVNLVRQPATRETAGR